MHLSDAYRYLLLTFVYFCEVPVHKFAHREVYYILCPELYPLFTCQVCCISQWHLSTAESNSRAREAAATILPLLQYHEVSRHELCAGEAGLKVHERPCSPPLVR